MAKPKTITTSPSLQPITVSVNQEWLGFMIGLLDKFDSPSAWDGTEADREQSAQNIDDLQRLLMGEDFLNLSAIHVLVRTSSGQQSWSGNLRQLVTWETAEQDSGAIWDAVNNRIVLPTNGILVCGGVARLVAGSGGFIAGWRTASANNIIAETQFIYASGATAIWPVLARRFVANDWVEMTIQALSGGSPSINKINPIGKIWAVWFAD
jgi:hypothetical protein